MQLSLGARTSIGVAVLLSAMLGSGLLTLNLRDQQVASRRIVIKSYKLLNQLESVISIVKDAETGQRGYLLTVQKAYLQPYEKAKHACGGMLAELQMMLSDSPLDQDQLARLIKCVRLKFEELQRTIELCQQGKRTEAMNVVNSNKGKQLMEEIRELVANLQLAESNNLLRRTQQLDQVTANTTTISVVFTAISLVSVLLTALLLHMFLGQRRIAEQKLAERSRQLEQNQRELTDLFDNSLEGLQWVDQDGNVLKANAAQVSLFGCSHYEYVGKNVSTLLANNSVTADILQRLRNNEQLHNYPVEFKHQDGTIKYLQIDATAYNEEGQFRHSRWFTRNITRQKAAEHELKSREARTRAILDTAPDAILIVDAEGIVESANRAARDVFMLDREHIIGRKVTDLIPDFFSGEDQYAHDLMSTGSNKLIGVIRECIGQRSDNSRFPIEVTWSVLNLDELSVFTLVIRDVSKRKSEEARVALQHIITVHINESNTISEVTAKTLQSVCDKMGFSVGEFWQPDNTGKLRCTDSFSTPSFAESVFVKNTVGLTFSNSTGLPGRVRQSRTAAWIDDLSKDANFVRANDAAASGLKTGVALPVLYGDEVLGVMAFFTAQLRAKDAALLQTMTSIGIQLGQFFKRKGTELMSNRQRLLLELMLDTMSDGIVAADTEGHFIIINRAAEHLFGKLIDMDPSAWSKHYNVFLPDEKTTFPSEELPLARAMRGESVDDVELYVIAPNGRRYVSVTGRPVRGGELFEGGMVVCRDITERKIAERRVSEFYSTVSHELRTPLTSIRGSLGLMDGGLAGPITPKSSKLIKIAIAECDRLIRLINDILDIRKIEAGMLELKISGVDASALIHGTIENIRSLAAQQKIEVVPEIAFTHKLECDQDRVSQVLTNLISNAIKFSPAGGKIVVRLDRTGTGAVRFSVIDQGQGIAKENIAKLFQKFQQLDQSDSRQKGGTGLGLAVCKAIVEQHGGSIGVDSTPGQGSTFWFELPNPDSEPILETTVSSSSGKEAIHPALIVEDDENVAEVLKNYLENNGFGTIRAGTLEEARKLLARTTPLVVVLDLKLPDGNGLDILRELSCDSARKGVPVVIVSAMDGSSLDLPFHSGLVKWVGKPFNEQQISGALDLAKEHIRPATVLIIEDDQSTRLILREQLDTMGLVSLEASDGTTALKVIKENNPDLIILDLHIPPPDGFQIIEQLRKDLRSTTPLIVYTASDLTEEDKHHLQLGMTAHFTKGSTTHEQLLTKVREFLNGLLLGKENSSHE